MNKNEYTTRRAALMQNMADAIEAGDIAAANTAKANVESLDAEFEAAAQAAADYAALQNRTAAFAPADTTPASQTPFAVMPGGAPAAEADPYDTAEYRTAFMNFVCHGGPLPTPAAVATMSNAAATTTTTDASAVIPTTLAREIIQKMESYGNIYAKVRKMNVQGGVDFPVLTLKPTASWVGESTASDDQKIKADSKVSFSYYGLECKIAQTLLASVVTLEEFQAQFVPLAVEAIIKAAEKGIVSGDGSGKFTGITADSRVPAANKITIKPSEFGSWQAWQRNVFAKMKKAYRNGVFIMAQGTFDGYINGMTDANGQPIGRVNYGITDGEVYRFGGKIVETVEDDIIADFDTAAENDVVAVFVDLKDYAINSNMQMTVTKWVDNDANKVKNKVTLIADGKLLDANGVLIIKKGKDGTGG